MTVVTPAPDEQKSMTVESPDHKETMGRVIPLRPRRTLPVAPRRAVDTVGLPVRPPAIGDLSPYEQDRDQDDYRHRMITNGAALLICVVLVMAGVWIANTMAEMRKNEDCVLSGRRGCMPLDVTLRSRN